MEAASFCEEGAKDTADSPAPQWSKGFELSGVLLRGMPARIKCFTLCQKQIV
jgi:hypothetical protein